MSKKSKRKTHQKKVQASHREQLQKLKARVHGKEDGRADAQAAARAAVKYVEERQPALAHLEGEATDLTGMLKDLAKRVGRFEKKVTAAVTSFDEPMPPDDSIQQVCAERDQAIADLAEVQAQLSAQKAEMSELRLHKLAQTEPKPPNWLVRAEREFNKTARILTNDMKTTVAQKALDWAKDYRLVHGHKVEPVEDTENGQDETPEG
jgi:predicted  nucleic acid-binding Zn-ribbon protein